MKTGQKIYRLFFALGFVALGNMLQGCEGEEKEVSKWVGTYKVDAKLYASGEFLHVEPIEYVIGDIPRLFLDQPSASEKMGPVVEIVLENNNQKISFFWPTVSPLRTTEGGLHPNTFIHSDSTYNIYASPATAERIMVQYISSDQTYDLRAKAMDRRHWVGPYTKTSSQNQDCRKYETPCKK